MPKFPVHEILLDESKKASPSFTGESACYATHNGNSDFDSQYD